MKSKETFFLVLFNSFLLVACAQHHDLMEDVVNRALEFSRQQSLRVAVNLQNGEVDVP